MITTTRMMMVPLLIVLSYISRGSALNGLPWGDVNILVVTDVHSWVGGHQRHEPHLDANYGHVLSFYRHLQDQAESEGRDLFFVMNGDFMDGTGLSTVPPQYLTPILEKMPWDAVNVGNHELYHNETIKYLLESGFIDHWNGNYLSSNTLVADTEEPLGNRYTYLYGKRYTILVFGFLYNFEDACSFTMVENVEDVVQQDWFARVLSDRNYDAIVVLAHMDCVDPLLYVILEAIRSIVGTSVTVQFITGHTHRRAFAQLDERSASMEAGRFLDTVGFASFSVANESFQHTFLDANVKLLSDTLGDSVHRRRGTVGSDCRDATSIELDDSTWMYVH